MKTIILLAILVSLSACAAISTGPSSGDPLDGTAWTLFAYSKNKPISGTAFTLEFNAGELRGSAGCNSYFGSYQIEGETIKVLDLAWTEMACLNPEGLMEQERTLMAFLGAVARYEHEDGRLLLLRPDGEALSFDHQPAGD
jgi:heat shock protein HslJ